MVHQERLSVETRGRGTFDITRQVQGIVDKAGATTGLCTVFIQHTSASLIITENADPDVRTDLETWMAKTVRDGDRDFIHTAEGDDDMSAHVRTILTDSTLTIPITDGKLALGTWQGVYVWEHRARPHKRNLVVTVLA
jgi:secondary thiamine-phosphate synthase enzyme